MKQINKFIDRSIYANISTNTRIMSILGECLPASFAAHIECIGITGQTLGLATDSSARSSQLRFYSDDVLATLHREGISQVRAIKVSTHACNKPMASSPKRTVPGKSNQGKSNALSQRTCELITSTAQGIDDERLRAALEKLVKIGRIE